MHHATWSGRDVRRHDWYLRFLAAVEVLDGVDVVGVELEVGHVALVPRVHERAEDVGVAEAQGVSELVRRYAEQIRTCT